MIDDMVFRGSHLASVGTNLLLRTGAGSQTAGTSLGVHGRVIEFKLRDYIAPSALPGTQKIDIDSDGNNEHNNDIRAAGKRKHETDLGSSVDRYAEQIKARARSIDLNQAGGEEGGGDGSGPTRSEDDDSGTTALCKDGRMVYDNVEVDNVGEYGDDELDKSLVSPASKDALINRSNSNYIANVHLLSQSDEYLPSLDKRKEVSFMEPIDSNSSSIDINPSSDS